MIFIQIIIITNYIWKSHTIKFIKWAKKPKNNNKTSLTVKIVNAIA